LAAEPSRGNRTVPNQRARRRPAASVFFALLFVVAGIGLVPSPRVAEAARQRVVPDQYIVTLQPGVQPVEKARRVAAEDGAAVRHVYGAAVRGFSARLTPARLKRLQADPQVASIVPDTIVSIQAQGNPTGIRRAEADRNGLADIGTGTNPIAVDVAIIDTGIDLDHPDLNVVGGKNCVPGATSYDDAQGHGTHVAGTVAARDNTIGVVGVAPGARLWAVRVLGPTGQGTLSDVICGVDWVTLNHHVIEVANMSLGGPGAAFGCDDGGFQQAV